MSIGVALEHIGETQTDVRLRTETEGSCAVCGLEDGVRYFDVVFYVFENDYDALPARQRIASFCAHVLCWQMACAQRFA